MKLFEHEEQKKLIKWWSLYSKTKGIPEDLLFAIPNGGKRTIQTAVMLRDEGVRPGVPDLFLAYETYNHAGLFIEMKKKKGGVLSENQERMIDTIKGFTSFKVEVCHGFDEAREAVIEYIEKGE